MEDWGVWGFGALGCKDLGARGFESMGLGILESSLMASAFRSSGARFQGLVTSGISWSYRLRLVGRTQHLKMGMSSILMSG